MLPQIPSIDDVYLMATSHCPMRCTYCYIPVTLRAAHDTMSMETLDKALSLLIASPYLAATVGMHAHLGEPLSAGIHWYRQALPRIFENFDRVGKRAVFTVQTSGLPFHKQFLEVFRKFQVQVGLSVDGPAHVHDRVRKTRSGRSTYLQVSRVAQSLRAAKIDFHGIAVITPETLRDCTPKQFLETFIELGFQRLSLNPVETLGIFHSEDNGAAFEADFSRFLTELIEVRDELQYPIWIREIDGTIERIVRFQQHAGVHAKIATPLSMLMVGTEGELSTFSPDLITIRDSSGNKPYVFGNVHQMQNLDEILIHPRFQALDRDVRIGVDACNTECPFYQLCGGGFVGNKVSEHGTARATQTQTCRLRIQTTVQSVLTYLDRTLPSATASHQ